MINDNTVPPLGTVRMQECRLKVHRRWTIVKAGPICVLNLKLAVLSIRILSSNHLPQAPNPDVLPLLSSISSLAIILRTVV